MKTTKNTLLVSAALFSLVSIVFFMSGCGALGGLIGGFMTSKTADLSVASVQVRYIQNIYPKDAGTIESDYFPDSLTAGMSIATIQFLKRTGIGFYQIDGVVKIGSDTLKHVGNGTYARMYKKEDHRPKKITVLTSTGQQADFTVQAPKPLKLISVNGKASDAAIDLDSDLTLAFDVPAASGNPLIKVSLVTTVVGVRSFADIGVFALTKKLTIPSAAFKHLSIAASANNVVTINTGKNYLLVERFELSPVRSAAVGAQQTVSCALAWMPVTVTGTSSTESGFSIEGRVAAKAGEMSYSLSKPNAFTGRPLPRGKKFALTSFSVRGVLYHQESSSSTSSAGNVTTTTTSTRTWQFPELPEAFWDQLLESVYADVVGTLKQENGIDLIPVEAVLKSRSYAELESIEDTLTKVAITRSYKKTKTLLPTRLSNIIASISSTFASDRIDARLMKELGVDGLIAVTLDLYIPTDRNEITLAPRLAFRITGPPNGYVTGPTIYAQGVVWDEQGVPFSENDIKNIDALNTIVRKDDLLTAFKKSLQEMSAKEKELGYDAIWALQ